ncbi:MAG: nickel/cobalt efflux transporter RcnA [Burkholderiales bacterium]|nr:nickel/cobalt efflux transporter RcnA [Burkholderiales bacterium]MDE2075588.1 nickel/cobalt efflux transporter RcnA [Burkholderiales bacterium]MDE2432884.1 nickel/cobalt efflux transporter RcnA [Burkholderiales bacterium]
MEFANLLHGGNAWMFLPSAILLGALHGLEPGHSKSMMAAFIVAVRGTVSQAVMLGLSATLSHTAVVWAVAMAGLYFGRNWNMHGVEAYLQLSSAVIVLGVAAWMIWRTSRAQATCFHDHGEHAHHHPHSHDHEHGHCTNHGHAHEHVDAHAAAHEADIQKRFANQAVTTPQIVMFGLTGGLIPCPASVAVLLLCLQVKRMALGATLVMGFSVGLAMTMVASGVLAALSIKRISKRWSGFGAVSQRAPYLSGVIMALVGIYMGVQGWQSLNHLMPN